MTTPRRRDPADKPITDRILKATNTPVSSAATSASVGVTGTVATAAATYEGKTLTYVPVAQGGAGTTVLAAANATKKHKLLGAILVGAAGGTIKFSDSAGDLTGVMITGATPLVMPLSTFPYLETSAINKALNLVSVTAAYTGIVILLTEA